MRLHNYDIIDVLKEFVSVERNENFSEAYYEPITSSSNYDVRKLPKAHLLVLKSKSSIINMDKKNHENWKLIDEAFGILDNEETCSKILKVAASCENLNIFFDFKASPDHFLNSIPSPDTTYESANIYIGVGSLTNNEKMLEAG